MDEHRWKFKVGFGAVDQYRAVIDHEAPRIEVLDQGTWRYFAAGAVVAEEMLRLATENESLGATAGGQAQMISSIRQQLRIECGEIGDNSWPDNLHPSDVIEKYLAHPAAARIAELGVALEEEENSSASLRLVLEEAEARIAELEREKADRIAIADEMGRAYGAMAAEAGRAAARVKELEEEHEKDLAFMASCRTRVERAEREAEELRAELHRFHNDAVEANHDLSVKLELAELRVKELEARKATEPHPMWRTPLDLL